MCEHETIPRLSPDIARACHERGSMHHLVRLGAFLLFYGLGLVAIFLIMGRLDGWLQYAVLTPVYLLMAASLHGISLFTHEAVHSTLSKNRFLNAVCGAACAMPVLQNYSAYRVLHLRHHQHLGEDGDPDHYANYTRWTWLVFLMNWARLIVGYPIYIVAIPILGFKHGNRQSRVGIVAELVVTAVAAAVIVKWVPLDWLWHAWVLPMLIINLMVNIRGMSQHTLLEHADDEVRGTRSILTSGIVRFFMCNENYHLEHHLYPGVPWHHLPKVHQALEKDLRRMGAPYISSYGSFVKEFIEGSMKRSPLGWKSEK